MPTSTIPEWTAGSLIPALGVDWTDPITGQLYDLSTGWTFTAAVYDQTNTLVTGLHVSDFAAKLTGAATGPNLIVAWPSAFASLPAGDYVIKLAAIRTSDSAPMHDTVRFRVTPW